MAVVTPSGPLRSLAVIAACLVGGLVGAILHGMLYEKHGWFSGFGFAFGAVALGLVASVVVDIALPLFGVRLTDSPAPAPAAGAGVPKGLSPPQHYAAAIFSLRLLVAFLGAVVAVTSVWGLGKLAGYVIEVPRALTISAGLAATVGGVIAGWQIGLALARTLDLTVE